MKKYCLTQCAKSKLYSFMHGTFIFAATLLLIIAVVLFFAAIGWVFTQVFPPVRALDLPEYALVGIMMLVVGSMLYFLLKISYLVAKSIWIFIKSIPDFTLSKLRIPKFKCRIFEECTNNLKD